MAPSFDVESPILFVIFSPLYAAARLTMTGMAVLEFSATSLISSATTGRTVFANSAPVDTISLIGVTIPSAALLVPAISSATSLNTLPSSLTTAFNPPALNASCRRST